jgi:hypothetical protein
MRVKHIMLCAILIIVVIIKVKSIVLHQLYFYLTCIVHMKFSLQVYTDSRALLNFLLDMNNL